MCGCFGIVLSCSSEANKHSVRVLHIDRAISILEIPKILKQTVTMSSVFSGPWQNTRFRWPEDFDGAAAFEAFGHFNFFLN